MNRTSRRWTTAAAAGALAIGLAAVAAGCSSSSAPSVDPSATSATNSATPNGTSTTGASKSTGTAPGTGQSLAPAVPVGKTSNFGNGLEATVTSVTKTSVKGSLPGEISGSAVKVDVTVTNKDSKAAGLDSLAVNLYFGNHATNVVDSANTPITGILQPGQSVKGTYYFAPASSGSYQVQISHLAQQPVLVFTGKL